MSTVGELLLTFVWFSSECLSVFAALHALAFVSARIITQSEEEPTVARPLRFRYREASEVGDGHVFRTANCSPSLFGREDIEAVNDRFSQRDSSRHFQSINDFVAAELFLKSTLPWAARPELSVSNYWEQIIGECVIPYSLTERVLKFRHAYDALGEYLPNGMNNAIRIENSPRECLLHQ